MPLKEIREINHFCNWGLWEITESYEELISKIDLNLEDAAEFSQIHNESKKLEWLTGKLLVKKLVEKSGKQYSGIYKNEAGKPFLKSLPFNISITHSQRYVGAILNFRSPVGIDLEKIKQKVLNVRIKFLSPKELETAAEDLEVLTKYWCGKEALYKLVGKKGVVFSKDLYVDLNSTLTTCSGFIYHGGVRITKEILFEKIEDYIIAIAL